MKHLLKPARFFVVLITASFILTNCKAQQNLFSSANNIKPRMRVIVDNDFGGDPDGLFELTHILLSPSR